MPYIKDFNIWISTPSQIIDEVVYSGYIYDEYLKGIEELVKKEASLYSEEILEEQLDAYLDPTYPPTIKFSYRNFSDYEGFSSGFVQELPSLIRGSALITLLSIFEYNIKYICEKLLSFSPLNISYADLSGHRAVDKFKISLKILGDKIFDEEKPFYINKDLFKEDSYLVIKDAYIIRNCFAHANGRINFEKKQTINKNGRITNYFKFTDSLIKIEEGALISISEVLRNFYNSILKI